MKTERFWETTTLANMSRKQWESLCDHCGKCCLLKLEDVENDELAYTDVVCRYYDQLEGGCTVYPERSQKVPTCVTLTTDNIATLKWMPNTCAYRLVYERKPLPDWHPLVSGDPNSVWSHGHSICGRSVSETEVAEDDLVQHVIWMES